MRCIEEHTHPWGQTLFTVYNDCSVCYTRCMARPLRIQYAGAIYYAMARGNGRQPLFHEDDDYQRLEKTVARTGWEVFAYVLMPNHSHLFFRTPKPNLSQGMQYLLSGYANCCAGRYQWTGHLLQG